MEIDRARSPNSAEGERKRENIIEVRRREGGQEGLAQEMRGMLIKKEGEREGKAGQIVEVTDVANCSRRTLSLSRSLYKCARVADAVVVVVYDSRASRFLSQSASIYLRPVCTPLSLSLLFALRSRRSSFLYYCNCNFIFRRVFSLSLSPLQSILYTSPSSQR